MIHAKNWVDKLGFRRQQQITPTKSRWQTPTNKQTPDDKQKCPHRPKLKGPFSSLCPLIMALGPQAFTTSERLSWGHEALKGPLRLSRAWKGPLSLVWPDKAFSHSNYRALMGLLRQYRAFSGPSAPQAWWTKAKRGQAKGGGGNNANG